MIEEAHELALAVLREHMEELHRISLILIERETIDKDQFERLLAGENEETVFPAARARRRRGAAAGRGAAPRAPAQAAAVPAPGRDDAASAGSREKLTLSRG